MVLSPEKLKSPISNESPLVTKRKQITDSYEMDTNPKRSRGEDIIADVCTDTSPDIDADEPTDIDPDIDASKEPRGIGSDIVAADEPTDKGSASDTIIEPTAKGPDIDARKRALGPDEPTDIGQAGDTIIKPTAKGLDIKTSKAVIESEIDPVWEEMSKYKWQDLCAINSNGKVFH